MITLQDVFRGVGAQPPQNVALDGVVREFVIDSRQAQHGDVFIALPGEVTDGHNFVSQALAARGGCHRAQRPPGDGR